MKKSANKYKVLVDKFISLTVVLLIDMVRGSNIFHCEIFFACEV